MKLLFPLLTAATLLAAPALATTMTVLLPNLDFPAGTVTESTKGCLPTATTVCVLPQE